MSVAVLLIGSLGLAVPGQAEDVDRNTSRLDHLLQAASHLEQAGREDLAAGRLRSGGGRDRGEPATSDEGRWEQIRRLELEIARLQTSPAAEQPATADQIVVQLKLIEFSWAKLQQSGLSLVSLRNLFESSEAPAIVDQDGQISEFIELLCKDGLAQVLSRPKLTTISGQPSTVEIGQDAKVPPGLRCGMRFPVYSASARRGPVAAGHRFANPGRVGRKGRRMTPWPPTARWDSRHKLNCDRGYHDSRRTAGGGSFGCQVGVNTADRPFRWSSRSKTITVNNRTSQSSPACGIFNVPQPRFALRSVSIHGPANGGFWYSS